MTSSRQERMPLPTGFCESCTASAKCLFFTVKQMTGWTCRFGSPHQLGTVEELLSRPECVLCSSIMRLLSLDHIREDPVTKELSAETRARRLSIKHSLQGQNLPNRVCVENLLLNNVSTGIVISIMKDPSAMAKKIIYKLARITPEDFYLQKFDPAVISKWLGHCEKNHAENCQGSHTEGDDMEIDLIDVEELKLVKATTAHRYVALSYVNGRSRGFETTKSTRESLSQKHSLLQHETLSLVVWHALAFAAMIGERYLWVDTLCIVQDDAQNKHEQIARMDEIYSRALVTFVSLSGRGADEGLIHSLKQDSPNRDIQLLWEGVLETKGTTLEIPSAIGRLFQRFRSPPSHKKVLIRYWPPFNPDLILPFTRYDTRGWTFQEHMLSSRIVFFSNWQIYAQCHRTLTAEYFSELGDNIVDTNPLNITIDTEGDEILNFAQYCRLVSGYTRRNLTFKTDILNAFAGISRSLERKMSTSFRYGLPERYFNQALFWLPTSKLVRRQAQPVPGTKEYGQLPSWSWCGWEGQAHYLHTFYSLAKRGVYEHRPEITFINEPNLNATQVSPEALCGEISSVVMDRDSGILRFEAWTVPGAIFTYFFKEQNEEYPISKQTSLVVLLQDKTLDYPILSCWIVIPTSRSPAGNSESHQESMTEVTCTDRPTNKSDASSLSDEDWRNIGEVWLTHESWPLHETIQNGGYSWVLLAREKGFYDADNGFVTRPEGFYDAEFINNSDCDEENKEMPWMAQLMLVKCDGEFAERIALAYIEVGAWDGVIAEKGERKVILLR